MLAPVHWVFRVGSLHLVRSPGWGLGGCRHRRHYLDCRESLPGVGNRNLRFPDQFHLEGGSFYTFQQLNDILRNVGIIGGSSGTAEVSPEGRTRSEAGMFDGDVAGDTGADGAGVEDAGGTTGVRGFQKVKGLGKSKGSVNRALGFALGAGRHFRGNCCCRRHCHCRSSRSQIGRAAGQVWF